MKKKIITVLSALSWLAMSACSSVSKPQDTVDTFWKAMENGDLQTAEGLVSESAEEYMQNLAGSADALTESLGAYDQLSEETAEKIRTYASNIVRITYGSHFIQDTVKISDTEYEVTVNVKSADLVSLQSAMARLDYSEAVGPYQEEITRLMNEGNLQEAYGRLFDLVFDYCNDRLPAIAGSLTYHDNLIVMNVQKSEDGIWRITDVKAAEPEE